MIEYMRQGTKRIRGRVIQPKIATNFPLPYNGGAGRYVDTDSKVLDTAMGFGCDIAQIKEWSPEAEVHGTDINIVMDDALWEDGNRFSYGRAREVVQQAFGRDILPQCEVKRGDATRLHGYISGYFDRVLSFALLHHLTRYDRLRTFEHAHRVLKKGGIYVAYCLSGTNMEPLMKLKGRYGRSGDKVSKCDRDGSPNANLDPKERACLMEDVMQIYRELGLVPSPKDWSRIERVTTTRNAFFMTDLTPDAVEADLKDIFPDITIVDKPKNGYAVVRNLEIVARK